MGKALVVVLAALAFLLAAGGWDWFSDDWLIGALFLMVAAGVLFGAFILTSRQIAADARTALINARNNIRGLQTDTEQLRKDLATAENELQKAQTKLAEADQRLSHEVAQVRSMGTTFTESADRLSAASTATNDAKIATTVAAGALTSAGSGGVAIDRVLTAVGDDIEKLPENQRLVGMWVSTGLAIAVLGFLAATGVTITTSSDGSGTPTDTTPAASTPTETTETTGG